MKTAIGIDIGGTKTAVGAADVTGLVRSRVAFATESPRGPEMALGRIADAVEKVRGGAGESICGIGIGCAGPVDPKSGIIKNPYTLPGWDGWKIVQSLADRFGVPVCLENDADAAAMGECLFGAGKGHDPVVMLTFGTGIGGAVISGGQIYRGVRGEHPEIGHVPVSVVCGLSSVVPSCDDRQQTTDDKPSGNSQLATGNCYCGTSGCLESIASGTAIESAGREAGFAYSRAVFSAAAAGDAKARAIIDRALHATAVAGWTILHTFLPQRIILGGGIIDEHFDLFASAIRGQIGLAKMVPPGSVSVAKAALGGDAGIVGAAALIFAMEDAKKRGERKP